MLLEPLQILEGEKGGALAALRPFDALVAAGSLQFLSIGLFCTWSEFVEPLHDAFEDASYSYLAFLGTAICALSYTGPGITAYLAREYGYRASVLAGGAAAVVATLTSSLVTSPWQLFFTYTLCYGLGDGLIYNSSTILVADAFEHTALAMGVAQACGMLGYGVIACCDATVIGAFGWRVGFQSNALVAVIVTAVSFCSVGKRRAGDGYRTADVTTAVTSPSPTTAAAANTGTEPRGKYRRNFGSLDCSGVEICETCETATSALQADRSSSGLTRPSRACLCAQAASVTPPLRSPPADGERKNGAEESGELNRRLALTSAENRARKSSDGRTWCYAFSLSNVEDGGGSYASSEGPEEEEKTEKESGRNEVNGEGLKGLALLRVSRTAQWLACANFLVSTQFFAPWKFVVMLGQAAGIHSAGVVMPLIVVPATLLGSLAPPLITERLGMPNHNAQGGYAWAMAVSSLACGALGFGPFRTVTSLVVFFTSAAAFQCAQPVEVKELWGAEGHPDNLAVQFAAVGSGVLLGGWSSGYVYERTDSFASMMLFVAGFFVAGALCHAQAGRRGSSGMRGSIISLRSESGESLQGAGAAHSLRQEQT